MVSQSSLVNVNHGVITLQKAQTQSHSLSSLPHIICPVLRDQGLFACYFLQAEDTEGYFPTSCASLQHCLRLSTVFFPTRRSLMVTDFNIFIPPPFPLPNTQGQHCAAQAGPEPWNHAIFLTQSFLSSRA